MFTSHCILNTGQIGSEWVLVGVATNSQRGTNERIREKMVNISEIARARDDNGAEVLHERIEEAEAAVREERLRADDAENRAEMAEMMMIEERERIQEAERRSGKIHPTEDTQNSSTFMYFQVTQCTGKSFTG